MIRKMSIIKIIIGIMLMSGLVFNYLVNRGIIHKAGYSIEDYRIDASINNDGSMDVVEYLKFDFSKNMNGTYRELMYKYTYPSQKDDMYPTSVRYQASGIDNIDVFVSDTSFENMKKPELKEESMLSIGMDNVYSIQDVINEGYRKNIRVYSPVEKGNHKYVKISYTINDAIVNYNDYAEIYWNFVGKDWKCTIKNLDINVDFKVKDNLKTYGHTYANIDNVTLNDNILTMKVSNIKPGIAVDVRGVFPNIYMDNITKNVNENYNFSLLNEIEDLMKEDNLKHNLNSKLWIYYIAIYLLVIIYFKVSIFKQKNKKIKSYRNVEYNTELLNELSLGEYNILVNKHTGYKDSKLFLATILDLVNRKYIKLECRKKFKFIIDIYEYYICVDTTKGLYKLNDYEKEFINYLCNKKNGSEIKDFSFHDKKIDLIERFKEIRCDRKLVIKFIKSCKQRNTEEIKKTYNSIPRNIWIKVILCYPIILILILISKIHILSLLTDKVDSLVMLSFTYSSVLEIFIHAVIYTVLIFVIMKKVKLLKEEYAESYNKLLGLKKYLKKYSLIKTRYPIELVLWEKYLVFATLFGIADKVAKEFRKDLIDQGYDEKYIDSNYPLISVGLSSDYINHASPSSTGSRSSGGFSGGGSGGGGRRWRRRWCILNVSVERF